MSLLQLLDDKAAWLDFLEYKRRLLPPKCNFLKKRKINNLTRPVPPLMMRIGATAKNMNRLPEAMAHTPISRPR